MAKRDSKQTIEELQMKEKIKHLEQALVNSELRAGMESKFYSEGALGELNPTLKTVLDILKGISSVRGR